MKSLPQMWGHFFIITKGGPMDALLYTYLFILGLVFGSFFNVVGLRVPLKKSIVKPRSHCPSCGHELAWWELIPVVSYFLLKGRCRSCQEKISPIYPLFELMTGVLFVFAAYKVGFTLELLVALTLISLLVIVFIADLHYMLIPNKILLFFMPILVIERLFISEETLLSMILGLTIGFFIPYLIAVISKGGMGGGDIKLLAVLGFVLGWKQLLLAFFLSTFYGAIIGGYLLATKKKSRKEPIPFGPFIVFGTLTVYFYGKQILDWYISLI